MSSGLLETLLSYFVSYLTALWYLADRDGAILWLLLSINILRRQAQNLKVFFGAAHGPRVIIITRSAQITSLSLLNGSFFICAHAQKSLLNETDLSQMRAHDTFSSRVIFSLQKAELRSVSTCSSSVKHCSKKINKAIMCQQESLCKCTYL